MKTMKTLVILVMHTWACVICQEEDTVGVPFLAHLHLARAKALHDLAIAKAKLHRTPNLLLQANPDNIEISSANNESEESHVSNSRNVVNLNQTFQNYYDDPSEDKDLAFPSSFRDGDSRNHYQGYVPKQLENTTKIVKINEDVSESILKKQTQNFTDFSTKVSSQTSPFFKSKEFKESVIKIESKPVDMTIPNCETIGNSSAENDSKQKLYLPSKIIIENNTQTGSQEEFLPNITDMNSKTHKKLTNLQTFKGQAVGDKNIFHKDDLLPNTGYLPRSSEGVSNGKFFITADLTKIPYETSADMHSYKNDYKGPSKDTYRIFYKNSKFPSNFNHTDLEDGHIKFVPSYNPEHSEDHTKVSEPNKYFSESILKKQNSPFFKSKDSIFKDPLTKTEEEKSGDKTIPHFKINSDLDITNDGNSKQRLQSVSKAQPDFQEEPLPIITNLSSDTKSTLNEDQIVWDKHIFYDDNYPKYEDEFVALTPDLRHKIVSKPLDSHAFEEVSEKSANKAHPKKISKDNWNIQGYTPLAAQHEKSRNGKPLHYNLEITPNQGQLYTLQNSGVDQNGRMQSFSTFNSDSSVHMHTYKNDHSEPNDDTYKTLYKDTKLHSNFKNTHLEDEHVKFYPEYNTEHAENHTKISETDKDFNESILKKQSHKFTDSGTKVSSQNSPFFKSKDSIFKDPLTGIVEEKSIDKSIPHLKINSDIAITNDGNSKQKFQSSSKESVSKIIVPNKTQPRFEEEPLPLITNLSSDTKPTFNEDQTVWNKNILYDDNYPKYEHESADLVPDHGQKTVSKPLDSHIFETVSEASTNGAHPKKISKDNWNFKGYTSLASQNEKSKDNNPLHYHMEITPNHERLETAQNPAVAQNGRKQSVPRLNGHSAVSRKGNHDTHLSMNDFSLRNQWENEDKLEDLWNSNEFSKVKKVKGETSQDLDVGRLVVSTLLKSQEQRLFQTTTEETYSTTQGQYLFSDFTTNQPNIHQTDHVKFFPKGFNESVTDNLSNLENTIFNINSSNSNVQNSSNLAYNSTDIPGVFETTTEELHSTTLDQLFFFDIQSQQPDIQPKENVTGSSTNIETVTPNIIDNDVSNRSNLAFNSTRIYNKDIYDNLTDEDLLPLLTANQNASSISLDKTISVLKTKDEFAAIPLAHNGGVTQSKIQNQSDNQDSSSSIARDYPKNHSKNNSQYLEKSIISQEQPRQQVLKNEFQRNLIGTQNTNAEEGLMPANQRPTDMQRKTNYKTHSQNRNFDNKFKDNQSWRQDNQQLVLLPQLQDAVPPLTITISQPHFHEISEEYPVEISDKTFEESISRLKHYIQLMRTQNEQAARNYHKYANIKSTPRESEVPMTPSELEYPEAVGAYLLHFPRDPHFFGKRFRREIRSRKNKKVVENKRRHPLPLISLLLDPKAKLDVRRTIKNFGTVTKNSLEDEKAPVQHVKNMISSARNAVLATMRIPPEDMIVPSKYKIVNRDILKEKSSVESRQGDIVGESSPNANGSVNQVFQRVGSMMRQSVESGQAALQHFSDIAHNARKVFSSTRESIPKLFFPYIKVPEIIKEENPKKVTVITPRFADIGEEISNNDDDEYLKVGKVMDALGLSHPTDEKIGTMKFVIRPKNKQPVLQSRFGEVAEEEEDPGQYVISNRLEGKNLNQSEVTEILEIFHTIKAVSGAATLKELLSSMKDHLKGHAETSTIAPVDDTEDLLETTWKIAKDLTEPILGVLPEINSTYIEENSGKNKSRQRRTPSKKKYQEIENAEFAKFLAGYEIVSSINPEVFRAYFHQPLKIDHTKDVNLKLVQNEIKNAKLLIVPPVVSATAQNNEAQAANDESFIDFE